MAGSMIGRVLNNRYELIDRVGLGGMAEVYRAHDKVLDRTVAIKVMLPQYASDPTFQQRFRREAASAARLQSPFIVNIYDWDLDSDGETYYIVMEFLKGTDLKTAIRERGPIDQRKAAAIGSQVAQALSVAHDGGIIHRDIKPQNIMIQPDGNIKVMDFGIARAGDAGLSQTSTVLGTAHYISPEQAQGKDLTGASDIYSLGMVLYEATTGRLPFDGNDSVSVAVKQVNEMPPLPSSINPAISPTLEAIIMKAIAKDPAERFQNAAEMKQALNDFLAGRPVMLGDISNEPTRVIGDHAVGDKTAVMPRKATAADATADNTRYINKKDGSGEPNKNKKIIIGVIVAIVAVAAIIAAVLMLTGQGDKVSVPNVVNQTTQQAEETLRNAGFEIGNETEVYSTTVPAGQVVSTNPPAGEMADKGSKVDLSISKGTERVNVPNLEGLTSDEARRTLAQNGLEAQEGETVFSDTVEEGRVATQDQAAGSSVNKGDVIVFHLSKGVEMVSIPDVVGASESKAENSLENAGFKVNTSYSYSDTVAEGNVISQSKTGSAKKGSTITITVSNGPEQKSVSVTDVVGMTVAQARAALDRQGLKVAYIPDDSPDSATVTKQSPSAGSSAREGTVVTLTTSAAQ